MTLLMLFGALNKPMKISIVIPVYNVAAYIERCLNSVFSQIYSDIECVLVDDCGTDHSMAIARELLDQYAGPIEFKIVRHEKNRGLSAARNTGTDAATGDYVFFLDSDDLILPDSLSLLAQPLKTKQLDLVVGNYASGGETMCFLPLNPPFETIHSGCEILRSYLQGQWFMMAWNKMVRREFLLQNNIRFVEGLLHEDNPWSFEVACTARSMGVVRAITYIYCLRQGSIVKSLSIKNLDSWIQISEIMENVALRRSVAENPDVAGFLTHLRESLAHRAKSYGRKTAVDVYRRHVRSRPLSRFALRGMPVLEKTRYLHHYMPPYIGYFFYDSVIHIVSCICGLFKPRPACQ